MAVLLETSMGDLVIELYTEECPNACTNFLKLCKIKHYNNCLFHTVEQNFIAKSGDPTNSGQTGPCIWSFLSEKKQFFDDEIRRSLLHDKKGIVATGNVKPNENGSAFYITLIDKIDYLNDKHTIFGFISEGIDVLEKINDVVVDDDKKPFNNIRILHTVILDDPMEDPVGLTSLIPINSPEVIKDLDYEANQEQIDEVELLENLAKADAKSRAINLELLGDLPDADMKPPENVLFVCKLNPVTQDGDLELIFSRFGNIVSCEIIRDWKTGDSLQYAFVEFDNVQSAEEAYFKMQDCLIDDRRIHVDFSQSVAKHWNLFKRNGARATAEDAEQLPFGKGKGKGKGKRREGGKDDKDRQNGRREGEENRERQRDVSEREETGKRRDERKDERKRDVGNALICKRAENQQREHDDERSDRRASRIKENTHERHRRDPTGVKRSPSRDQSRKTNHAREHRSKSRSIPRTRKLHEETKNTPRRERSMSRSRRESKKVDRKDRSKSPSQSKKTRIKDRSASRLRRESKKVDRKDRSRSPSQSKKTRRKDRSASRTRRESKNIDRKYRSRSPSQSKKTRKTDRSASRTRRESKKDDRKDRSRSPSQSKKTRKTDRSASRTRRESKKIDRKDCSRSPSQSKKTSKKKRSKSRKRC